ncbi:TPA: virulence factor TspB C-terminal domain-related protein [Vibrio mimicus]
MRIFTGIVIKLFLLFPFFFSPVSISSTTVPIGAWMCVDSASSDLVGLVSTPQGCLSKTYIYQSHCKSDLLLLESTKQIRCYTTDDQSSGQGNMTVGRYGFNSSVCPDSYTDNKNGTCTPPPPQCSSDQILNPETNTCEARCTAPDVWDPVTQQCITAKNRCDILGERKPVVEVDWRQSTLGSSVVGKHSCMPSSCVVVGTKDVGCLSDSDRCYGDAKYTGTECTYTEGVTSGWCSDETCSDQTPVEPVPDPDNPNPEPPSPNPDPTPGDNLTPPNPDTSADPNNPNLEEEGNKGVVNELNTANKTLENIQKTLEVTLDEITTQNKDVDKANDKLILGIQNLAKAVSGAGSSGGGGGGDGDHVGDADVASFNCDAETFQCKGDVIQCLSAEIQFKEHCINSELKQLETSFKKIASVDNVKAIVQEEEIDLSKIDTKYLTGSGLSVSGQCPPDYTFTVDIYIQTTVTIPLTDLCAAVQRFAPLIVLFGWISGIGLIGRQQGFY